MATSQLASSVRYAPGQRAPSTGIYRVIHDQHRPVHPVCVIKGDEFPHCGKCRDRVRFQLFLESDYLNHDWDLAGPALALLP